MKRLVLTSAFIPAMLIGSILNAQDLDRINRFKSQQPSMDQVAQTEDMWFYMQELRRYDDPQVAIRAKAAKKADQRRQRLAAMKWFGWSQGRPNASSTPWTGVFSPSWVGNGADPYEWIGYGYTTTAVRVDLTSDTKQR
ncbi:MAG: hypothetical protein ACYC3X_26915 [Pirellulaceae bacterium]